MSEMIVKRGIKRYFATGEVKELTDELINECRLSINLEGEEFVKAVLSPTLLEEFVLGFLFTRGLISGCEDISSLDIAEGVASVIRDQKLQGELPVATLLESTGARNVDLEVNSRRATMIHRSGLRVRANVVITGTRLLSEMPVYNRTGGAHCAILFSPTGEPVVSAEDLGRHNSVDKVIGTGLKKGIDFSDCWLAVSGRLPTDMVLKSALAGIPLVASVSAVTSEGARTGEITGVTVVGFVREGRLNCYSHPHRVI